MSAFRSIPLTSTSALGDVCAFAGVVDHGYITVPWRAGSRPRLHGLATRCQEPAKSCRSDSRQRHDCTYRCSRSQPYHIGSFSKVLACCTLLGVNRSRRSVLPRGGGAESDQARCGSARAGNGWRRHTDR